MRSILLSTVTIILLMASCSSLEKPRTGKTYETDQGMEVTFYTKGNGPEVDSGDVVKMHYLGRLENDSVFGSSYKRNQAFRFEVGNNEVIDGWEQAVKYMQEGDSALLKIPPHLAYGDKGAGTVPANATLLFTVKLEDVKKPVKPFDISNAKEKVLESGVKIYTVKKGKGQRLDNGMFVQVHYSGYLENGEIFDSSVERDEPLMIQLGKNQVIKGWEKALKTMNEGEKARIIIPPEMAYGEQGRGEIPPNETLSFDLEILNVHMPEKAKPFEVEGLDTTFTESGVGIIKVRETDQPRAQKGNTVTVHYTGYLKDGEKFDSSVEAGDPIRFELGKGRVIKGWDIGLQQMRKGEKARLIIPYQLAYGESGAGPIPPKAMLIFDVELLDVK